MFIIHLCENSHAGITVSEGFDLEKQQHFAGCVETLCPDGLQRNHSCRLWLILFSLLIRCSRYYSCICGPSGDTHRRLEWKENEGL